MLKVLLYVITPFLIISLLVFLSGCTVTHERGHRPKIEVNNPYADKTKLKLKDDEIMVYMEWDI